MSHFVTQRSLYEVRERPSKTYSWQVFITSNVIVELPWNTLAAALIFFCFYYPIGMYKDVVAADQTTERGGLFFLFIWVFLMFTSTFTDLVIAGIETAEEGGNIANMLFSMCLIFCGVLASPKRPTGLLDLDVSTCGEYLKDYISTSGGYLLNPEAAADCQFCSIRDTNSLLAGINLSYDLRWRNFGIIWAFIVFNVCGAFLMYWWVRVPKPKGEEQDAPIVPATSSDA
ncbi:hypothetical protein VE01_09609 [Pseudogymnoascus verrucosus]|uniref:ABC-2 type transporter domain-containing protein n=1 Tax=Pseudogymnoascus verrucosus TaxID=342668 RepID=A0A1B8G9D2_9PEZI|nr:uncharacterized protein VE01_09609 [Pseudogymnoascus verrucosus]OBT92444.1 hypothetical protein VE01_09609 [Pseudogymnoascus verrucosus]